MEKKHDKWIIGESPDGFRTYIVHTEEPRFTAEVFDEDDEEGVLSGISYQIANGQSLANFMFIEDIPDADIFDDLVRQASQALDVYDTKLGITG